MPRTKKKTGKLNVGEIPDINEGVGEEVEHSMTAGGESGFGQTPAGQEEQLERAEKMTTQGRKGCKAPRISLTTTPTNYEYISILAKTSGRTMTRTINDIIDDYRKKDQDFFNQAKALLEKREGGEV